MAVRIEIADQPPLGLSRTAAICFSGIYHRLFRSSVTVMVIALAVAFFVMVLANAVLDRGVRELVLNQMRSDLLLVGWASWLAHPVEPEKLAGLLTDETAGDRANELLERAGLSDSETQALRESALEEQRLRSFFERLQAGRRRALVGGRDVDEVLRWLVTDEGLAAFEERLATLKAVYLPGGLDGLREFVGQHRATQALRRRLREGHAQAIEAVRRQYPNRPIQHLLVDPPPGFIDVLGEQGFRITPEVLAQIGSAARRRERADRLAAAVRNPDLRRVLANRLHLDFFLVTPKAIAGLLSSSHGTEWFRQQAADLGVPLELDAAELREAADYFRWQARREQALLQLGEADTAFGGIGERAGWLVLVSLVVCTVGIANAMLMSVTERFREIATMKCLGAADTTIMALFVMESCLMGLAGGVLGGLLGLAITVGRGALTHGGLAWQAIPAGAFGTIALVALGYGVLLAGVAAVYPAFVAARLAPMEAMRVE